MDRKSQNLEFSQKLCAKSEGCLERRPHKLYAISRPVCASGGDIAVSGGLHCNSKSSSYQDVSIKTNISEEDEEEEEDDDEQETQNSGGSVHMSISRHCLKNIHTREPLDTVKQKSSMRKIPGTPESGKYVVGGSKLKAELSKYKKELKAYNSTTKNLEEKYMKINYELNEMQQKHDRFVANRKNSREADTYSDSSSSTASEFALKRKYTQVFHRGSSFMTMLPAGSQSSAEHIPVAVYSNKHAEPDISQLRVKKRKQPAQLPPSIADMSSVRHTCTVPLLVIPQKRHSKRKIDANKENEPPSHHSSSAIATSTTYHSRSQTAGLKDIYKVLKNVLDTNQSKTSAKTIDLKELQTTIANLQSEQAQFRNIIQQQQSCLHDYHSRCIKAHHIMQTQQIEIEKLSCNNQQLETEISAGIDQLRLRIDAKLRDVAHLPQMMREEQSKYEKANKENTLLSDRLRNLQSEASQLKIKMDELGRRKIVTINRLKAAERDLKIFKNYNTALKHEKRKLVEELQKLKEQLETVQNTSKRSLSRQREQNEKQRRELQKRVFELELKLSRSHNSTTSLIQERDSLIAELQTQLNTLVHNFEVSQKHIRVLRRHIYTMSGSNSNNNSHGHNHSHNRLMNEAM